MLLFASYYYSERTRVTDWWRKTPDKSFLSTSVFVAFLLSYSLTLRQLRSYSLTWGSCSYSVTSNNRKRLLKIAQCEPGLSKGGTAFTHSKYTYTHTHTQTLACWSRKLHYGVLWQEVRCFHCHGQWWPQYQIKPVSHFWCHINTQQINPHYFTTKANWTLILKNITFYIYTHWPLY